MFTVTKAKRKRQLIKFPIYLVSACKGIFFIHAISYPFPTCHCHKNIIIICPATLEIGGRYVRKGFLGQVSLVKYETTRSRSYPQNKSQTRLQCNLVIEMHYFIFPFHLYLYPSYCSACPVNNEKTRNPSNLIGIDTIFITISRMNPVSPFYKFLQPKSHAVLLVKGASYLN